MEVFLNVCLTFFKYVYLLFQEHLERSENIQK